MDKALDYVASAQRPATEKSAGPKLDWRRKISNHVAWGLLIYTGLHIFVTMGALKTGQGSIMPYFSLIVLVGAIIPACRWLEKKWELLGDEGAADPAYAPRFWRHVALIWLAAIGLPVLLTLLFKAVVSLV